MSKPTFQEWLKQQNQDAQKPQNTPKTTQTNNGNSNQSTSAPPPKTNQASTNSKPTFQEWLNQETATYTPTNTYTQQANAGNTAEQQQADAARAEGFRKRAFDTRDKINELHRQNTGDYSEETQKIMAQIASAEKQYEFFASEYERLTGKKLVDNFWERAGNTTGGGLKTAVGDTANAVATAGMWGQKQMAEADPNSMAAVAATMLPETNLAHYGINRTEEEQSKAIQNWGDKVYNKGQEQIQDAKYGLGAAGQFAVDAGAELTKIGADAALSLVAPWAGTANMVTRSFGGGAREARADGKDIDAQMALGLAQAGKEYVLNKTLGGMTKAYGQSKLGNAASKALERAVKNDTARAVLQRVLNTEGLEEGLSTILDPAIKAAVYDDLSLVDAYSELELEDVLYSAIMGQALGFIGGGEEPSRFQNNPPSTSIDTAAGTQAETAKPGTAPQSEKTPLDILMEVAEENALNAPTPQGDIQTPPTTTETSAAQSDELNLQDTGNVRADMPASPAEAPTAPRSKTAEEYDAGTEELLEMLLAKGEPPASNRVKPNNDIDSVEIMTGIPATANQEMQQSGAPQIQQDTNPQITNTAVDANGGEYVPTQTNSSDPLYTEEERTVEGLRPEDSVHLRHTDKAVDEEAERRYQADKEGEKADLFAGERTWNDADTRLAYKFLSEAVDEARKTGDYSEVVKLQREWERQGTLEGQALRQRGRFTNTPEEIIAEAATKLEDSPGGTRDLVGEKGKGAVSAADINDAGRNAVDTAIERVAGAMEGKPQDSETFNFPEAAAKEVARTIRSRVRQLSSKTTKQKNAMDTFVGYVKKFAVEKIPKASAKRMTPTELLTEVVANEDLFRQVYELAQAEFANESGTGYREFMDEYINTPAGLDSSAPVNGIFTRAIAESAMATNETASYIAKQSALGVSTGEIAQHIAADLISKTGAEGDIAESIILAANSYVTSKINDSIAKGGAQAEKIVAAMIKNIGTKFRDIAVQSDSSKAQIQQDIADMLAIEYALSPQSAQSIAETVANEYSRQLKDAMEKEIERRFAPKEKKTVVPKSFVDEFVEAVNLGTFDSQYAQRAAEKFFGDVGDAAAKKEIINKVAKLATDYARIPEGDTSSVVNMIKQVNEVRKTTGLFSNKTSKQLSKALEQVSTYSDGDTFLRDVLVTQIRSVASDYVAPSRIEQAKQVRFTNLLSKLTTLARNFVGNNILDAMEMLSNNQGVALDMLLSKYTGTRSVAVDKGWLSKAKREGAAEGYTKSFIQVALDADVDDVNTKYEQRKGRTFKMTGNPLERFMSTWEKHLAYGLKTSDEMQKGGIRAEAQRGIDELKAKGKIADDALTDRANDIALERTLQNDSAVARAVTGVRRGLDEFAIQDKQGGKLGAGELLVPFAGVPANVTAKAVQYSPAGILEGGARLGKVLLDAHNGTLTADQQAKAVQSLGRFMTATELTVLSTALALKGIIKSENDEDKDKKAADRARGQRGTQINLSALMRWVSGGSTDWQDSDALMDVGFAEQLNGILTMGVALSDAYQEDGTLTVKDIATANGEAVVKAVSELPALSSFANIADSINYSDADTGIGKVADAAMGFAVETAGSFVVPNAVRGVAAGTDKYERDSYGGDSAWEQQMNYIKSGIPGLRQTLPKTVDSTGRETSYEDEPFLHFLNNNILPGRITKYENIEYLDEIDRLMNIGANENAGVGTLYPDKKAPNTVNLGENNKKYELSEDEKREYQAARAQANEEILNELIESKLYDGMSDEVKALAVDAAWDFATYSANRAISISSGHAFKADNQYLSALQKPAEYIAANTAYKIAADKEDYSGIDAILDAWDTFDRTTKSVLLEKTDIDDFVLAAEGGVAAETYATVKEAATKNNRVSQGRLGEALDGLDDNTADVLWEIWRDKYNWSKSWDEYKRSKK